MTGSLCAGFRARARAASSASRTKTESARPGTIRYAGGAQPRPSPVSVRAAKGAHVAHCSCGTLPVWHIAHVAHCPCGHIHRAAAAGGRQRGVGDGSVWPQSRGAPVTESFQATEWVIVPVYVPATTDDGRLTVTLGVPAGRVGANGVAGGERRLGGVQGTAWALAENGRAGGDHGAARDVVDTTGRDDLVCGASPGGEGCRDHARCPASVEDGVQIIDRDHAESTRYGRRSHGNGTEAGAVWCGDGQQPPVDREGCWSRPGIRPEGAGRPNQDPGGGHQDAGRRPPGCRPEATLAATICPCCCWRTPSPQAAVISYAS